MQRARLLVRGQVDSERNWRPQWRGRASGRGKEFKWSSGGTASGPVRSVAPLGPPVAPGYRVSFEPPASLGGGGGGGELERRWPLAPAAEQYRATRNSLSMSNNWPIVCLRSAAGCRLPNSAGDSGQSIDWRSARHNGAICFAGPASLRASWPVLAWPVLAWPSLAGAKRREESDFFAPNFFPSAAGGEAKCRQAQTSCT